MADPRFRGLTIHFRDYDLSVISGGDTRVLTSVEATTRLNGVGEFSCTYPYPVDASPAYGVLEQIGHIVSFLYYDYNYAVGTAGWLRPMGDCYIIENIELSNTESGQMVRLSGRSLLAELEAIPVWEPIGESNTFNTTLLRAIIGQSTTTVSGALAQGAEDMTVASATNFAVNDMVIVPLTVGGSAYMIVSGIEGNVITFSGGLPGAVSNGVTITRQSRLVVPNSTDGMTVGSKITVTLNSGSHVTVIEREAEEEENGDIGVLVRDAFVGAANVGNAVVTLNKSEPATNDIEQIMSFAAAAGWSETETGFGNGSAHVPDGASVLELLQTVASIHNTPFRQALLPTTLLPTRSLVWGSANSGSTPGSTRIAVGNIPHSMLSSYEKVENKGIVNGGMTSRLKGPLYSRVYPSSGAAEVTLYGMSALTIPLIDPYVVVNDPAVLGLYSDPYIYYPALEATGFVAAKVESFSHITAETTGIDAYTSASDMLAIEAADWLRRHAGSGYDWELRDVSIYSTAHLFPGQKIDVHYFSTSSQVRTTHLWDTFSSLVVTEIRVAWNAGDSRPRTDITLNSSLLSPDDAGTRAANKFRTYDKMVRRFGTQGVEGRSISVATVSSGTPVHSHSEYLSRSGGNLTGNLTLNAGLTVDGVDLSAHAANAAAHHALVTAGNAGISVSGQAVSAVADTTRGLSIAAGGIGANLLSTGGLEVSSSQLRLKLNTNGGLYSDSSGLAINISAGYGLELVANVPRVKINATNPGLQMDSSGISVLLKANSGILVDSSGMALSPSTLTAITSNAVSGSGHTHAITATATGVSTYDTLLKSGSAGELAVRFLGVGAAVSSSATAFMQSVNNDDYTLYLKQKSGQTADVWRVENSTGNALIRLTGGGDLESGTPGFTSGLTGWQIAYDGSAEFNNVRIRGELHAATFVADEMHAVGGTLLVKTATTVAPPVNASDNVLPAINSTFTLLANASYNTALNYLPNGSIIRIKPMGEIVSGGSLDLYDIYAEVVGVSSIAGRDLANGKPGYFPLSCTLRYGGTLGGTTGDATGFEIPAGSTIVLWTQTGASGYTGAIKLTNDGDVTDAATESPFMDVFTVGKKTSGSWAGVLPVITPRVRVGNLRGVLGKSADEWGLAAGTDLSDTDADAPYIVASDAGITLRNTDLRMFSGTDETFRLTSNGYLAIGTDVATSNDRSLHFDPITPLFRLGQVGTNKPNIYWDTSAGLKIRSNTTDLIVFEPDGDSYFAGRMTIGTNGEILQGSGTKGTVGTWSGTWGTFTGLRIGNDSGVGKFATYSSGVVQAAIDSTGKLLVGAGAVTMDANGMKVICDGTYTYDTARAIKFVNSSNATFSSLNGTWNATNNYADFYLRADNNSSGGNSELHLISTDAGSGSSAILAAGSTTISVNENSIFDSGADYSRFAGGIVVGGNTGSPAAKTIRFFHKTSAPATPATDTAEIYVLDVAGVQKFYIKFDNGTVRELATA